MADTFTAVLKLTKPEKRKKGWGSKWDANADALDDFLATTLAADADPNDLGGGVKVGGYQNQLITDANGVVWLCTTTDLVAPYSGVVWEKLGQLTIIEAIDARNVWTAAQATSWRAASPGGTPIGVELLDTDSSVYFTMSSDTEIRFDAGAVFGTNDAQQIVLYVTQDPITQYNLTSVSNILWPGGVASPPSPAAGEKGVYSLLRIPGVSNEWLGFFNLGY